jgi:hypothetical protein
MPVVEVLSGRSLIVALTARHRLPAVYPPQPRHERRLDLLALTITHFRRAASHVDRILKGESRRRPNTSC